MASSLSRGTPPPPWTLTRRGHPTLAQSKLAAFIALYERGSLIPVWWWRATGAHPVLWKGVWRSGTQRGPIHYRIKGAMQTICGRRIRNPGLAERDAVPSQNPCSICARYMMPVLLEVARRGTSPYRDPDFPPERDRGFVYAVDDDPHAHVFPPTLRSTK